MSKLDEIKEGWKNKLFPNSQMKELIEQVSSERRKICDGCEYISTKHFTIRPDVHCTNCGCTLSAKTRSLKSECPIGKWKKIQEDNEGT